MFINGFRRFVFVYKVRWHRMIFLGLYYRFELMRTFFRNFPRQDTLLINVAVSICLFTYGLVTEF